MGFPGGSDGKEYACNEGDLGLIPGLGRSPGEGKATHSSILAWRILMDRGAWQATVLGAAKSQTRLSEFHTHNVILIIVLKIENESNVGLLPSFP